MQRGGGTVVWVPRGGAGVCSGGVCGVMERIDGSSLSSKVFNVSVFAPFDYDGMPGTARSLRTLLLCFPSGINL
ncbi:hypothetical protein [Thermococcus peptonophilus]|uniref:hypothetical protein n=1 Tax=Thermococcus peptonophilus TaxID=53952 RepID=UPI00346640D1